MKLLIIRRMLKNRTKEQVKQLKLNSTLSSLIPLADNVNALSYDIKPVTEAETEYTTNYNNLAIIDIPNYLEPPHFKNSKTLLICMFQMVTDGLLPFIVYLLAKNKDELHLVQLPSFDGGKNNKFLQQDTINYMTHIISDGEISYAGFIETAPNNIIFLKYVPYTPYKSITSRFITDHYYWVTAHELVNLKHVIHIPISKNVVTFFMDQPSLLTLKNEKDIAYEIPVIGYYDVPAMGAENYELMDIYREMRFEKYGKCYYFHMNFPIHLKNKSLVMRTVLFLEKTGLLNNSFHDCNSLVYNKNELHYYLIKNYSQHFTLSYHLL